jgi:glucuronoarabinoxylan endo-1,4-beta-xylanase
MKRTKALRTVLAGASAGALALSAAPVMQSGISAAGLDTGYYIHDTFEDGTDGWEGRGGASVSAGGTAYEGSKALTVSGRTSSWHGAMKSLGSETFQPGKEYSFSAAVSGTGNMMLSLQYKDASGETKYGHIANGEASGDYIQLANASYALPEGSDYVLYFETESGTGKFSIDDVIIAEAGTVIDGPKPLIYGDINSDQRIDSFDIILARKGVIDGLEGRALKAGDVDGDGEMASADLVQLSQFVLGERTGFERVEPPEDAGKVFMDSIRDSITVNVPSSALANAEGGVEHITYFSKKANRNKGANVWLPPGYDPSKKYPVFYVNHGYGGDEGSMVNGMGVREIATNLIKSGEAEPMIIVFTNQYTDPAHEKQTGNGQADVPGYDNFVEDLPDSLMPYIESHYPVKTGRENTAVAGFSMGGRESLYIGIRCCDKVGYIGGGAPAPGIFPTKDQFMTHPGVMSKDDMRIDPPYAPYLLMIAGGTNDGMVNDFPKQYSDLFTEHGTENIYISVPGGGHDSKTVIPLMYNFIRNLFKATK